MPARERNFLNCKERKVRKGGTQARKPVCHHTSVDTEFAGTEILAS